MNYGKVNFLLINDELAVGFDRDILLLFVSNTG